MTTKTIQVRFRLDAMGVWEILAFHCIHHRCPLPTNLADADAMIRTHLCSFGVGANIRDGIPLQADARVCVSALYPELAAPAPPPPSAAHSPPSTLSRLR